MIRLEIGPVAHGGHCVAHHDGRVVFVRHTLPGEVVMARLTGGNRRIQRADAVEILTPSPDRVPSVWPAAGPGGVGGGELAHVSLEAGRRWKSAVLADQLSRLAGLTFPVRVQALPGEPSGLGYRTRIDLVADDAGRLGMHGFRTHRVRPLDAMPLAVPAITDLELFSAQWPAGSRVEVAAPSVGSPVIVVDGRPHDARMRSLPASTTRELVGDNRFRVAADGFWQVHQHAPQVLTEAVMTAVGDVAGATVWDLYSGVGLFTVPLAQAVGESGTVWAVEGDPTAVRHARRNLHAFPQARLRLGDVAEALADAPDARPDVVVLDPPRSGAKAEVVQRICAAQPDRVVYVACDPAALGRDLRTFGEQGYQVDSISGYDLFPLTHHVESVAVLSRVS